MYQVKNASDFREEARKALKGNWWIGAIVALVAMILGASTLFNATTIGDGGILSSVTEELPLYPAYQQGIVLIFGIVVSVVVFLINLAIFLIAGAVTLGYIQFNFKILNGEKPKFKDLFSQFKRFGEGLSVHFFRWLFVILWTLAGVGVAVVIMIPFVILFVYIQAGEAFFMVICGGLGVAAGIFVFIKMLDYVLAPYIVYDNPGIGGREALKKSKRLMNGNKGRLFGLTLSFIGWGLLANLPYMICFLFWKDAILFSIPLCVGSLWLKAYQEVAYAAFYKQVVAEDNGTILSNDGPKEYVLGKGNLDEVESVVQTSRWNY